MRVGDRSMIEVTMGQFLAMFFGKEYAWMDLWWTEEGATGASWGRVGMYQGKVLQVSNFSLKSFAEGVANQFQGTLMEDGSVGFTAEAFQAFRLSSPHLFDPETQIKRFLQGFLGKVGPVQITCRGMPVT